VTTQPAQLSFFTLRVPRVTISLSEEFFGVEGILAETALQFFQSIEADVREAVRGRMRDGGAHEGEKERDNLASTTIGGDSPSLRVYGTLVQTFVDEFGLQPQRAFPPWRKGSPLYEWALRHGIGQDTERGEARFLTPSEARAAGQFLGAGTAKAHREGVERQVETAAFLIARAIYTRGLPRPNDPIREPFAQTFEEFLPEVRRGLEEACFRAADIVNGVGVY
jgi:hypothetical protein